MRDRDSIYRDILNCCRRRAEQAWWRSDQALIKIEKSHLGLIPHLLRCHDERQHRHYLDVDRPRFLRSCKPGAAREFEPLWAELTALHSATAREVLPVMDGAGVFVLDYRNGKHVIEERQTKRGT